MPSPTVTAKPQNLYELGTLRADKDPDKPAVIFLTDGDDKTEQVSYGELDRRAKVIANALKKGGQAGKPVLLLFEAGIDFICAFFGCQYAGSIAVPVQASTGPESWNKLQGIIADADASLVLSTAKLAKKVAEQAEGVTPAQQIQWLLTEELAADEDAWEPPVYPPTHVAFLQYTSGSTGTPKGVMISHANILYNSMQISQNFNTSRESVCVSWLPHFHDMGLIGGIIQPLFVGCPLVLMSPMHFIQRPARWLKAMSKYKGTTTGGPNFSFDLCIKIPAQDCEGLDLRLWQVAYNGGEPVRKQTLDNFAQKFEPYGFDSGSLLPCYGLAESTLFVTGRQQGTQQRMQEVLLPSPDNNMEKLQLISSGRPQQGTAVKIINHETLAVCAPGMTGEVWVAGNSVSKGYWNKPDATMATMQGHYKGDKAAADYLRTGDLGFLDDGELYITGRLKDMLIINGNNLFPQDIEQSAGNAHAQIIENGSAAFSRLGRTRKEELVIVCELKRNTVAGEFETIRKSIQDTVFFQFGISPADIVFTRQRTLPRTSSGKIRRFLCKQYYLSAQLKIFNT